MTPTDNDAREVLWQATVRPALGAFYIVANDGDYDEETTWASSSFTRARWWLAEHVHPLLRERPRWHDVGDGVMQATVFVDEDPEASAPEVDPW